jgi:hypothetical protein
VIRRLPVSIAGERADAIVESLLAEAPLEAGCFCLVWPVRHGDAVRYVLGEPIPSVASWQAQGERNLTPSSQTISAAISAAISADAGLCFVHSHPMTERSPRLSAIDERTTLRLGRMVRDNLEQPLLSLVLSEGGWGGAASDGEELAPTRISIVGRTIRIFDPDDEPTLGELDTRQELALGTSIARMLRGLRVAVVGAGGLGSPLAETLTRMGVGKLVLIDDDLLDTPSNARRIFGTRRSDISDGAPMAKAEVVAGYLKSLDLGTDVSALAGDVTDSAVLGRLLDVDAVFTTTDTHSSRAAVSETCVRAAIPLIDGGVRVGARASELDTLYMQRRIQIPSGPCLWCWGLDAERIREERLPTEQRAALAREGYVAGEIDVPVPSVAALTVTAAGTMASAMVGLLTGAFEVAPLGRGLDALSLDVLDLEPTDPDPDCVCARYRPA